MGKIGVKIKDAVHYNITLSTFFQRSFPLSNNISTYSRPNNLDDALQMMQDHDVKPLAGGAHLLAEDVSCETMDIQKLGLGQVALQDEQLQIGSTTKLANLAEFLADHEHPIANFLQKAIHQAGPNTYRHAATVGGVIARRLPDSELLAALLVLDTNLMIYTPQETASAPTRGQAVSLTNYLANNKRPFGLITQIQLPWAAGTGSSHRVARTPADYPIVSITGWKSESGGVKLAATGLSKRPLRLTSSETKLSNGLTEPNIQSAATAAQASNQHAGDFRGDAIYRANMAAILTRRTLQSL